MQVDGTSLSLISTLDKVARGDGYADWQVADNPVLCHTSDIVNTVISSRADNVACVLIPRFI